MLQSWFGEKDETVKSVTRSAQEQARVDQYTAKLALYHYDSCWFCGRVRNTIERLNLTIELRNIHRDPNHHEKLKLGGGMGTVPCLCIENDDGSLHWLYESADIIRYLESKFS